VSLLYVGVSFGYMPRSGIAGSSGRIISNFLRSHHIDFQSGLCFYVNPHYICTFI
jgi:putative Ca2+/H+ antiporter (TMEM165/GDT1 family)